MDRLRYRRRHLRALTWGAGGALAFLALLIAAASGHPGALVAVGLCIGLMLYGALKA